MVKIYNQQSIYSLEFQGSIRNLQKGHFYEALPRNALK